MAAQVHVYPKVERQLADMMHQSNGRDSTPAIAAQRARQIIDSLIRGMTPASCGLMKPRMDKRVKNSLKFYLGSGFRLICIKDRPDIHVMFVGDHDSCDAWLDHNTKKKPHKIAMEADVFQVQEACAVHIPTKTGLPDQRLSLEGDPFIAEISQKDLRRVFSGLCSSG